MLILSLICCVAFADELAGKVEKKILSDRKVKVDHLQVTAEGTTIRLEGVANLYGSRYRAGEIASHFKGVSSVDNRIAVTTPKVNDIDLQSSLAARIERYYKSEPFDLISLKVTRGVVQLFGIVRDTQLKDKAFEEVIWTPGVRDVDDKIRLASIGSGDERLRQKELHHDGFGSRRNILRNAIQLSLLLLTADACFWPAGWILKRTNREFRP